MTYLSVADAPLSSASSVYFVGPGALFSRVALRTVETELDGPTRRVPDIDALRAACTNAAGTVVPALMVVVHETCAHALLEALEQGADFLPKGRLAIAIDNEDAACALFADIGDALLKWRVSLLPMNTNVTGWVRLLQVIQAGSHYVPPEVLQVRSWGASGGETARHEADAASGTRGADGLTPRESEVLAMAAAGSPNKTIAGALELSEHTVKLYMHRIIGKLGAKNRTEAAAWYHQHAGHG